MKMSLLKLAAGAAISGSMVLAPLAGIATAGATALPVNRPVPCAESHFGWGDGHRMADESGYRLGHRHTPRDELRRGERHERHEAEHGHMAGMANRGGHGHTGNGTHHEKPRTHERHARHGAQNAAQEAGVRRHTPCGPLTDGREHRGIGSNVRNDEAGTRHWWHKGERDVRREERHLRHGHLI